MNTDRFQGSCLVANEGRFYMVIYDIFPPEIRLRLQSSTYNLCAACVQDIATRKKLTYIDAIRQMEAQIRASEAASDSYQNSQ